MKLCFSSATRRLLDKLVLATTLAASALIFATLASPYFQVLLGETPPAVGRSGGDFAFSAATDDDDHNGIDAAPPPPPGDCDLGTLDLQPLSGEDRSLMLKDGIEKMFLLETSLKPSLSPRKACAVESAHLHLGLDRIFVMLLSPILDLSDIATCQLYRRFSTKGVEFRRIVPEVDFSGTPLEEVWRNGTFQNSKHIATHLSDGLRIAYLFKFGGWYADTDYVFIRSLEGMRNVVSATAMSEKVDADETFHVTNCLFHLDRRHVLAKRYMEEFAGKFVGKGRTEVGPLTFTKVIRQLCQLAPTAKMIELSDPSQCFGITVQHPDVFHPFRPYQVSDLFPANGTFSEEYWEQRVARAKGVHFFGAMTNNRAVSRDPTKDALSYYAQKYCPVSYESSPLFSS